MRATFTSTHLGLSAVLVFAWLAGTSAIAASASDLPRSVLADGFEGKRVGAGTLKWLGFEIYDAALWTSNGSFANDYSTQSIAFSLWYRRGFTRDRLIDITRSAWSEFSLADPQQQRRWSEQLADIWLDVRKGSNMTTLVMPNGVTRFYSADRYLGRIEDPAFGPAFLKIWLDPQVATTRLGNLRADLLDESD